MAAKKSKPRKPRSPAKPDPELLVAADWLFDPGAIGTPLAVRKREQFCRLYVLDAIHKGNGRHCAIRAGYAEGSAVEEASRLLALVKVAMRVRELQVALNKATAIDSSYVRRNLARLTHINIKDIVGKAFTWDEKGNRWDLSLDGLTRDEAEAIQEIGFDSSGQPKLKLIDRLKSNELLGKHVDINAFSETVNLQGNEGLAAMILRARAARKQRREDAKKEDGDGD